MPCPNIVIILAPPAFAEAYPDSMRAAAARLINEDIGDAR
jgi:hypothetical protein